VSRWLAVEALGPCYTLSVVIEHATPEAARLRRNLQEARDHLKRFVQRQ
jgi:cobalamin biosynthesis protein CobD/CbiB